GGARGTWLWVHSSFVSKTQRFSTSRLCTDTSFQRGLALLVWGSIGKEPPMKTLDAVLNRIDQEIDHSVERLFALLRIASVSTDPAFKDQCRAAAEHVAADLKSIGFEATVRPTAGHPVVVGKSNSVAGPRVLFYGHYDVQPVDPLNLWKTPPF